MNFVEKSINQNLVRQNMEFNGFFFKTLLDIVLKLMGLITGKHHQSDIWRKP